MRKQLETILAKLEELIAESDERITTDVEGEEEQEEDRYSIVSEALQNACDEIDKALAALDD